MMTAAHEPTPQHLPLPEPGAIGRLFTDLLHPTTVKKLAGPLSASALPLVATYETRGAIGAVALCDFELAAAAGAALSLLPQKFVVEAVKSKKLSETLYENWREVFNIASSLMNHDGHLHARLLETYQPPTVLPPNVAALVARPAERLDLEVTIKGFSPGKLALFACHLP